MKKKILTWFAFSVILLVGINCKSTHSPASQKATHKAIYIEEFRLAYFKHLLIKSYNNSDAIQEIISNDHSGFTEPVLKENDYKLIDSLTIIDNEKMKNDSTKGNLRAEGAQGKMPLGFILKKLKNKWLDSLANERFRSSCN